MPYVSNNRKKNLVKTVQYACILALAGCMREKIQRLSPPADINLVRGTAASTHASVIQACLAPVMGSITGAITGAIMSKLSNDRLYIVVNQTLFYIPDELDYGCMAGMLTGLINGYIAYLVDITLGGSLGPFASSAMAGIISGITTVFNQIIPIDTDRPLISVVTSALLGSWTGSWISLIFSTPDAMFTSVTIGCLAGAVVEGNRQYIFRHLINGQR